MSAPFRIPALAASSVALFILYIAVLGSLYAHNARPAGLAVERQTARDSQVAPPEITIRIEGVR